MTRTALMLLTLLGLALLGLLDGDGVLARASTAARVLGLEIRVEVRLERVRPASAAVCVPGETATPAAMLEMSAPCE